MEIRIPTKKLSNGFEMPLFGLGTYKMGEEGRDQEDLAAIKSAIELGITHIDTAEVYADGRAEKLVGEAIKDCNRSKLFLVSKVRQENLSYQKIKDALRNSLKRLGTSYLDLYLMHRCPPEDKFKECITALNELVDEGLIRHIGLSNTNTKHTKMLCDLSRHPIVANQVHYNLQFREPEQEGLLNFCQKNDLLLIAWRPVNKAALAKNKVDLTRRGIPVLDAMCQKYQKTPAQIAINWLASQPHVVTLSKTSNAKHLIENLDAAGWQMEQEDIERLRREFPGQESVSDTVPLA